MSETTPQAGLETLSKEELQAKYKEVIGADPASNMTKAQLIVAITAKVEIPPKEATKPASDSDTDAPSSDGNDQDSSDSFTGASEGTKEPGVKTPLTPPAGLETKSNTSVVRLIRIADNTELTLPAATWANLPSGSKKQFKFQEPAEVKSLTEK